MAEHTSYFQAAVNYDDALWRAAAETAVQTSYWDIFGGEHHASREALQSILRSLGWDVSRFESIEDGRRSRFAQSLRAAIPATWVTSENAKWIPLTLPSQANASFNYRITLEDGQTREHGGHTSQLHLLSRASHDNQEYSTFQLPLPSDIPIGYHRFQITANQVDFPPAHLIICPDRTYLPDALRDGGRSAGFNISLYGLRSNRNWGCGDFTDLRGLTEWAHREVGFSFIGLNPLHALHNRTPYNASPYLPVSMYYKNHIYIDIEATPEFATSACAQNLLGSAKVQDKIRGLRASDFVRYTEVDRLKRRFLKVLYREFHRNADAARRQSFNSYCEREGDLLSRFALYCSLDEDLHRKNPNLWTWRDWPAQYQQPDSAESQAFARGHSRSIEYYKYIQFVIEEQLAAAQLHAKEVGMPIGLYHDLAVATDNFGSDLWGTRDHYVEGCRVGAPPDDFSPDGQDWGFPPPNKETHRAEGYELFRESIRKIVRHGGALRIDHVMRLYRLFWVPAGMSPAAGAYVRDYAEDLMHILALESVRSRNIIIGEDLGTITDEMRDLFTRFGILSYRLFPFEKNYQTGEFRPSSAYPRQALVSSSTHDLPTLAGFWRNSDIESRKQAGLIEQSHADQQTWERRREKQRMLDVLVAERLSPARDGGAIDDLDGDLHNSIIGFISQVPSVLLLLNQEDFTKELYQQNLPGTTAQYPNWQRKMRVSIEELRSQETAGYTSMFKNQLRRTGRSALA
jgi:4-alpha-glucanotransferase